METIMGYMSQLNNTICQLSALHPKAIMSVIYTFSEVDNSVHFTLLTKSTNNARSLVGDLNLSTASRDTVNATCADFYTFLDPSNE